MYHIYDIITVIQIYRLINNNIGLVRLFISRYTGMYSRNLLNEEFRDGFLIYNDIFAVRTRCVRRENGSSISEI